MADNEDELEKTFIGKFTLDSSNHPLFRRKEDAEKLVYNKQLIPNEVEPTNEQRFLSDPESQFS